MFSTERSLGSIAASIQFPAGSHKTGQPLRIEDEDQLFTLGEIRVAGEVGAGARCKETLRRDGAAGSDREAASRANGVPRARDTGPLAPTGTRVPE